MNGLLIRNQYSLLYSLLLLLLPLCQLSDASTILVYISSFEYRHQSWVIDVQGAAIKSVSNGTKCSMVSTIQLKVLHFLRKSSCYMYAHPNC